MKDMLGFGILRNSICLSMIKSGFSDGYTSLMKSVSQSNMLAYYPLTETNGTVAYDISGNLRHGTYSSDVSAWPVIGGVSGVKTAPIFDGAGHYISVPAAMSVLNGAVGTISFWYKVPGLQTWTDAITRQIFEFKIDASNSIYAYKSSENNIIRTYYTSGGSAKGVSWSSATNLGYNNIIMTWSKAADEYKMFLNNAQKESTRTSLGTWGAGTPTGYIGANVSAGPTPGAFGYGAICHFALWDTVISTADRAVINSIIPSTISWPYIIITDNNTYNGFPGLREIV